jgi:hypothetical protein
MTTRPIRWCRLAATAAVTFALTGCQDPRLQKELTRLEEQLEQADKRLEIATVQVEAANAQVAGLKQSLEQSQAETKEARQAAAEELLALQKTAETKQREVEQERSAALAELDNARRALAVAQSRLDAIAKQEAKAKEVFSPLGVWELTVGDERYRFSFHDDGTMQVRQRKSDGRWEHDFRIEGSNFTPLGENKFELRNRDAKGPRGRFIVRSETEASVWFDYGGGDFSRDDFDKPKWMNVKRVAKASTPGEESP